MNGAPLEAEGLTLRYGERTALRGVSFQTAPRELVALAGPNGSGKSSLLRAVMGLERLAEGRIAVRGKDARTLTIQERAREVAWMPQEEPVGEDLSVEEYVRYGRSPYLGGLLPQTDPDPEATDRAVVALGLEDLRGRGIRGLSGGERQRVRLARVLAQGTSLLLLDEPTSHLDIGHQLDMLGRVRDLARREGRSVIVAIHDLNLAARFADRVMVLSHGQLVSEGTPEEVLSPALLRQVWGVDAELRRDSRGRVPYLIPRLPDPTPSPHPGGRPRVHVVAGGGSGLELLRRLFDRGCDLTAGVLPLFDSDSDLAEELGVPSVLELPFAPLSSESRERLRQLMSSSEIVVVAAFPVGPTNVGNLEEVERVVGVRRVLLVHQDRARPWDFTGGSAARLRAQILEKGGEEVSDVDGVLRALSGRATRASSSIGGGRSDGPLGHVGGATG